MSSSKKKRVEIPLDKNKIEMAREIIREEYRPMANMPVAEIMPYLFPYHYDKYIKFKNRYSTRKKHVEEHLKT